MPIHESARNTTSAPYFSFLMPSNVVSLLETRQCTSQKTPERSGPSVARRSFARGYFELPVEEDRSCNCMRSPPCRCSRSRPPARSWCRGRGSCRSGHCRSGDPRLRADGRPRSPGLRRRHPARRLCRIRGVDLCRPRRRSIVPAPPADADLFRPAWSERSARVACASAGHREQVEIRADDLLATYTPRGCGRARS